MPNKATPARHRKRAISDVSPQLPGRTFGYVRVSSDEQIEGQSLVVQEQALRGWAQMRGHELHAIVQEPGISGGIEFHRRPAGGRLWADLRHGDTLVAHKLDRMFRSAADCLAVVESFKQRSVSLYLLDLNGGADDVSGNGIARLFLTIVSAFAEFERDRIGERIRATKRKHKAEGTWNGGVRPFGFMKGAGELIDGRMVYPLVPVPEEQAELRRIHRMAARGRSTYQIKADLWARGYRLSHVTIGKILKAGRGLRAAADAR
jgi:DNA invertase Pin-like site-specific DNA recombinase